MQKGNGRVEDKIRERYDGVNDPLAQKILDKQKETKVPEPPADVTISTLYVGGISEDTTKPQIQEPFDKFGKISGVRLLPSKKCAFVCFFDRSAAE